MSTIDKLATMLAVLWPWATAAVIVFAVLIYLEGRQR